MKLPAWSQSPEWAIYLTLDVDGTFFWHEKRPVFHTPDNCDVSFGQWFAVLSNFKRDVAGKVDECSIFANWPISNREKICARYIEIKSQHGIIRPMPRIPPFIFEAYHPPAT